MDHTGFTVLKIALTGHSSGFGPYIQCKLQELNHSVLGFSKRNGYDLSTQQGRNAAISQSSQCDIFINNSTINGCQGEFLEQWLNEYKFHNKTIINISSYLDRIDNPADFCKEEWINKKKLVQIHSDFKNNKDSETQCRSKILSWGYWNNHPFTKYHPELTTQTTIEQALEDIISLL